MKIGNGKLIQPKLNFLGIGNKHTEITKPLKRGLKDDQCDAGKFLLFHA